MKINERTLWIKGARLGFPHLVAPQPSSNPNAAAKYNGNFILPMNAPEWNELLEMVNAIALEKWTVNATGVMTMINADKRLRCYGYGTDKLDSKTGQVYEGFQDMIWISGSSDARPDLRGADAQPCPPTAPLNTMFVGGNYVDAVVSFWPQDNEHGKAIRAQLDGVQYIREGEKFGAVGPDVGTIFEAVAGAPAVTAPIPGMAPAAPAPLAPAPAQTVVNNLIDSFL